MIRIAICDDNKILLDDMKEKITLKLTENGFAFEIFAYDNAADFLKVQSGNPFDAVFLDIVMPDISGFDAAREMCSRKDRTYIIFITTESHLVFDSFDFQPFYFIPKDRADIMDERLDHVLERLIIHMNADKPICIECAHNEKRIIDPRELVYIKSSSNYIDHVLSDGEIITIREKLQTAFEALPQGYFAKIHNRIIVNMKHIRKTDIQNSCVHMDNGEILNISRANKKQFILEYDLFLEKMD